MNKKKYMGENTSNIVSQGSNWHWVNCDSPKQCKHIESKGVNYYNDSAERNYMEQSLQCCQRCVGIPNKDRKCTKWSRLYGKLSEIIAIGRWNLETNKLDIHCVIDIPNIRLWKKKSCIINLNRNCAFVVVCIHNCPSAIKLVSKKIQFVRLLTIDTDELRHCPNHLQNCMSYFEETKKDIAIFWNIVREMGSTIHAKSPLIFTVDLKAKPHTLLILNDLLSNQSGKMCSFFLNEWPLLVRVDNDRQLDRDYDGFSTDGDILKYISLFRKLKVYDSRLKCSIDILDICNPRIVGKCRFPKIYHGKMDNSLIEDFPPDLDPSHILNRNFCLNLIQKCNLNLVISTILNAYNLNKYVICQREYIGGIVQTSRQIWCLLAVFTLLQKYCCLLNCVISLGFVIFENAKTQVGKIRSLVIQSPIFASENIWKYDTTGKQMTKNMKFYKPNYIYDPMIFFDTTKQSKLSAILDITNIRPCNTSFCVYPVTNSLFSDMSNELHRLGTFHSFPEGNCPSFIKMAQAGFMYEGDNRTARCFSCKASYCDWSYYTSPMVIHRALSPECVYLNGHLPICKATATEQNGILTTLGDTITENPKPIPYISSTDSRSSMREQSSQSGFRTGHADSGFGSNSGASRNQSYHSSMVLNNFRQNLVLSRDSAYGSDLFCKNQSSHNPDIQTDHHATGLPAISEEHQQNGNSGESRRTTENPTALSDLIPNIPPPRYPEYKLLERRIATYKNWPQHLVHILHPFDLSECGFFYSNLGDCVRCYQCGIGLRNWESDDNPWVEHARWSRQCPYLIQRKGQKFIDTVLSLLGIQTDSEIEEFSRTPSEPLIPAQTQISKDAGSQWKHDADPLMHDAAKLVIREKMFPVDLVKSGMDELLKHNEWKSITSDMLVLYLTEKNKPSDVMVFEQQVFNASTSSVEQTNGHLYQNNSMQTKNKSNPENTKTTEPYTVVNPEKVQKENEELKDLYTCKICLDEKVGITFVPCGHLVTCKKCSPKIRRCPLCRTFIRGTIKTTV